MNAIGYMRLSARDQSNSLGSQRQAIEEYCRRNSIELIGMYTDNGKTSYSFDRPDYRSLELYIKNNRGRARYLIIKDHDRFSRNLPEALLKIEELEKKYGIKVLACDEQPNIDTTDPAVFIQRAFNYLMANQELFRIRKRTLEGMKFARLKGRYICRPPFGYQRGKNSEGKAFIVVDEAKATVVQSIFADYLSGKNFSEIGIAAKAKGFEHKGHSALQRILENCLYAGLIRIKEGEDKRERYIRAQHQPLIREQDYWKVQEMLGTKKPSKTTISETFLLKGILRCRCGQLMTAGYSKGRRKRYLYYRCIYHNGNNLPGAKLHEKFTELLSNIPLSEKQQQHIRLQAKSILTASLENMLPVRKERERQQKELEEKTERLEQRLIAEEIPIELYHKWKQVFQEQLKTVREGISALKGSGGKREQKKLDDIMQQIETIAAVYKLITAPERKTLVAEIFGGGLIYNGEVFRCTQLSGIFASLLPALHERKLLEHHNGIPTYAGVDSNDVHHNYP